jgi:hypothetical protein
MTTTHDPVDSADIGDTAPVTKEEAAKRPISLGLLGVIVLATTSIIGTSYTIGSKSGGGDAEASAEIQAIRADGARNAVDVTALALRVTELERKMVAASSVVGYTATDAARDWKEQREINAAIRENIVRTGAVLEALDSRTKRIETKIDVLGK